MVDNDDELLKGECMEESMEMDESMLLYGDEGEKVEERVAGEREMDVVGEKVGENGEVADERKEQGRVEEVKESVEEVDEMDVEKEEDKRENESRENPVRESVMVEGTTGERKGEKMYSEVVKNGESVKVEKMSGCVIEGCQGERGKTRMRHVLDAHVPEKFYRWDVESVCEWFRELMCCYGVYKGWDEAVCFVRARISVRNKEWRMPGRDSKLVLFEQLGRKWGEKVRPEEKIDSMDKRVYMFHWGVIALLLKGLVVVNRERLLVGWRERKLERMERQRVAVEKIEEEARKGWVDGRAWAKLGEESRMRVKMERAKIVREKKERVKESTNREVERKRRETEGVDKKVEKKGQGREESELRKVRLERVRQQKLWEENEKKKRVERLKEKSEREKRESEQRTKKSNSEKQKQSTVTQANREMIEDKQKEKKEEDRMKGVEQFTGWEWKGNEWESGVTEKGCEWRAEYGTVMCDREQCNVSKESLKERKRQREDGEWDEESGKRESKRLFLLSMDRIGEEFNSFRKSMIERSMAYEKGGVEREEARKESDECCQLVWREERVIDMRKGLVCVKREMLERERQYFQLMDEFEKAKKDS